MTNNFRTFPDDNSKFPRKSKYLVTVFLVVISDSQHPELFHRVCRGDISIFVFKINT